MSPSVLAILMFVCLIITIASGHPLAVCLVVISALFGLIDNGWNFAGLMDLFANNNWGLMMNYTLVAVPLFIYMAQILDKSQVSEGLFDALYIVLGGLRGGLGLAIIVVCTVLAATTGIVGASVTAMGLMAAPVLLRRGYNRELSSGLICAGGTLGILIPPSIMSVVYAGLTGIKETSVGNMFAGQILPGLVLSVLYFGYVGIRCHLRPQDGPPLPVAERTHTLGQKIGMTAKNLVPPAILIFAVMGTILFGVATATEAAAVGCVGAMILAASYRKLSWKVIEGACVATVKTTAMVMFLFVGGKLFSAVFLGMGGGSLVSDTLLSIPNRWVVFGIMMAFVFVLGMFIDWAAILLITVPIFVPIAVELGFDPLWFAVIMCVNLQTSFLTPPFGYALFYLKGTAPPEYTLGDIYRGIIPFVGLQVVGLVLMCVFPALTTWLPDVFFGR
jgi:tripartite ATP-independent transporter DctM subunit